MNDNLQDLAIAQALSGNWEEALKTNRQIIKNSPDDVEALNRLSRAYFELGDVKKAISTTNAVIKIDSQNIIARKSLEKYKQAPQKNIARKSNRNNLDPNDFIEEIGTSKHTELLNVCSCELLSTLCPGDELCLVSHSHKVSVNTIDNKYIGKVPDNLSAKIRNLTKLGYKYKVVIKSLDNKKVIVIIRETKRGNGFESIKSF